jgi:hypothetical protein
VKAALFDEILGRGGEIVCRPWVARGNGLLSKTAFKINMRDLPITCPAGETESIVFGTVTEFDPELCDPCAAREVHRGQCRLGTYREYRSGRAPPAALPEAPRDPAKTCAPQRARRRRAQTRPPRPPPGRRARYRGVRKNLFDLRRASAIQNLEGIQRKVR